MIFRKLLEDPDKPETITIFLHSESVEDREFIESLISQIYKHVGEVSDLPIYDLEPKENITKLGSLKRSQMVNKDAPKPP